MKFSDPDLDPSATELTHKWLPTRLFGQIAPLPTRTKKINSYRCKNENRLNIRFRIPQQTAASDRTQILILKDKMDFKYMLAELRGSLWFDETHNLRFCG